MDNSLQFMNVTKIHKRWLFLDGFWQIKRLTIVYIIYISRGYMSLTLPYNTRFLPPLPFYTKFKKFIYGQKTFNGI